MYIYNVYYIYIYMYHIMCIVWLWRIYYLATIAVKRCENPILTLANLSQGWPMQHVKANVLGLAVFLSILEQCSRLRSPWNRMGGSGPLRFSQEQSDYQIFRTLFRIGNPRLNLFLPLLMGQGPHPRYSLQLPKSIEDGSSGKPTGVGCWIETGSSSWMHHQRWVQYGAHTLQDVF